MLQLFSNTSCSPFPCQFVLLSPAQHRNIRVSHFEITAQREREEAARRVARDAELAAKASRLLTASTSGSVVTELEENPNHARKAAFVADAQRLGGAENVIEASGLSSAIRALDIRTATLPTADRHPEKRRKAAYKAYEEKMMKELREEYPTFKFSQLKQKIFEMWQDAPENPMNQKKQEDE